jgi:hypothetical protein
MTRPILIILVIATIVMAVVVCAPMVVLRGRAEARPTCVRMHDRPDVGRALARPGALVASRAPPF